jgi:hypothetical protein
MIGFIKYKLFKWLWDDICNKIGADGCEHCPLGCYNDFGKCENCKEWCMDCYDVSDLMFKAGRKAWKVE